MDKEWRFGTWKKDRWEIFIHSHFSRFLSWLIPFVESLTFSSLWNLCSHWLSFQECELLVQCVPEFYENLLDEKLEIPSFICLLARLALLCVCVVNRIFSSASNKQNSYDQKFPMFLNNNYSQEKKTLFHHSRTQKSEAPCTYMKNWSSAKRVGAPILDSFVHWKIKDTQQKF